MNKPGYKTTEFWFGVAAFALGALLASGVVAPDSTLAKIVGGALSVLATLGYTGSRTAVKKLEAEMEE